MHFFKIVAVATQIHTFYLLKLGNELTYVSKGVWYEVVVFFNNILYTIKYIQWKLNLKNYQGTEEMHSLY